MVSPRVEMLRPALGWIALVLLPMASLWARLVAHPLHLRDPEFMLVPTAGWEYAHGHLTDLLAQQINFQTHHGYLTDALLAAAGFTLLGDHYMAWEWIPLLYASVLIVAALSILRRTAGLPGAVAFSALFAAGPFLMKDGVLAMVGAHTAGTALMLAAVALVMGSRPGRHFDGRTLAAGATLAWGFWYLPTVVIAAVPVGALAALHGLRRMRDLAIGLAVIVPLWCVTVAVQMGECAGPDGEIEASLSTAIQEVLPSLYLDDDEDEPSSGDLSKVADVFGWTAANTLFAQPMSLADGRVPDHRGRRGLGYLWCLAWLAAFVTAGAATVNSLRRKNRSRDPGWWHPLLGLSLPLLYGAMYRLSPIGLEPGVPELLNGAQAPPIHVARYLLPSRFRRL